MKITSGNRIGRAAWDVARFLFYRPTPNALHFWRRWVLRCFGAHVASGAHPYPRARIWAPWNLFMEENSCLANDVDCYNVGPVFLRKNCIVSQYSYLCSASHDYESHQFALLVAPIIIGDSAWIGADVFVGPGVHVGENAVVAARSTVVKNVAPWTVVAGNPARVIKERLRSGPTTQDSPTHQ